MSDEDELLMRLYRDSKASTERVIAVLREAGREDLVAELEGKLRDVRLGLDSARSCWHSISPPQRRVLEAMEPGRRLVRRSYQQTRYDAQGEPFAMADVCGGPTVSALLAHGLIAHDQTPKGYHLVLTERGRFVLAHGRT
jgi:hypothetical protein